MLSAIAWTTRILVSLCVMLIFMAIFLDFIFYSRAEKVQKEKKSIVETGTMTLFFLFYYVLMVMGWGKVPLSPFWINTLAVVGWLPLVGGCVMNILGRVYLGNNWANHIKIYDSHHLVVRGPYRWVRHPLYSSIIWMLLGGSLIYHDALIGGVTLVLFVPMMIYRANQEEVLLSKRFKEYKDYQKQVGQLFPKWKKHSAK